VPLIVSWPSCVAAGTTSGALIELTDLFATVAAAVGAPLPAGAAEDSRNFLPVLLGSQRDQTVREYAVHHSLWGHFAVRRGPWKMIPKRGSGGFTRPREVTPNPGEPQGQLYHLQSDPSETKNVWQHHPEVVRELSELLDRVQAMGGSES
jgi:arylsulfatase A